MAFGIEEAIMIHHFQHWININRRLKKNFYEGRTWSYQTQDWITAHFPYFKNRRKTIRIIDSLVKKGILIKGNFNKTSFDRTVWYAFVDENVFLGKCLEMDFSEEESESAQSIVHNCTMDSADADNGKCGSAPTIPDSLTNTETKNCLSAVADLEKPKEILHNRIQKKNAHGTALEIDLSLVFHHAVQSRKDWETGEIEEAWKILADYQGSVNDLMAFIEGTIKNIQNKKKLNKIEESCQKKQKVKQSVMQTKEENGSRQCLDRDTLKQLFPLLP